METSASASSRWLGDRAGPLRYLVLVNRSFVIVALLMLAPAVWAQAPMPEAPAQIDTLTPKVDGDRLAEPEIPRSEPPELAAAELDLGWTLIRTMLVLAMVIGLAWLTLNVGLRRLMGIKSTVGTSMVTVLERVALDQKRALFVIDVAGEVLLVGGSEASLSLISKLDRAEVDRLRAEANASRGPIKLSPFLQKLLGRKDVPPPPTTGS